jgi:hypothetical protein
MLEMLDSILHLAGMGFFNGYSSAKTIWFVLLFVIMLILVYFFSKSKKLSAKKNNAFLKKQSRFDKIIIILFISLILLSLISQLVFFSYNSMALDSLSYVIYDSASSSFTSTSLTHIHTFKPILFPLKLIISGNFDWGLEILPFMPSWAIYFYAVSFVVFVFASLSFLLSISKRISSTMPAPKRYKLLKKAWIFWIALCGAYLLTKSISDGGIFTKELFIGFAITLIILLCFNWAEKNKLKFAAIIFATAIIEDLILKFFLLSSAYKLSPAQFVLPAWATLVSVFGFMMFIFGIAFLLDALSNKNLKKSIFLTILIAASIFCVFYYSLLASETSYNPVLDFKKMDSIIPEYSLLLAHPSSIDENSPFKVIESYPEARIIETTRDTSLRELSKWKNNSKASQYIFEWNNKCKFLLEPHTIYIKTKQKLNTNLCQSVFNRVAIKKCSSICDYEMSFYSSYCLTDIRASISTYLHNNGLNQFILFDSRSTTGWMSID